MALPFRLQTPDWNHLRPDHSTPILGRALRKLCVDLTGDKSSTHITVDVPDIEMLTERAIPISVIVNEIVMAVLEDTITNGRRLTVSLQELDGGDMDLSVVGNEGTSCLSDLGRRLVTSMAAQIDGVFTDEPYRDGYRAAVRFPKAVA